MNNSTRVVTRAKVNLSLHILGSRPDGYHEIETIFQCIDLHDELEIEITNDKRIEISCSAPDIPTDKHNVCYRAVVGMRAYAGDSLGARIRIGKNIPTGSGLGGGSGNAAGVIVALDRLAGLNLASRELEKVAAEVGSDVPFMLHGGTMLGRGRGEELTPLEPLGGCFFAVVKPQLSVSTSWAYGNLNFRLTKHMPRLNLKAVNAVLARFPATRLSFRNAFEDVICPAYPVVANILDDLLREEPCFASMTGSGSALYAVLDSEVKAVRLAERFSVSGHYSAVAKPAARAVEIL